MSFGWFWHAAAQIVLPGMDMYTTVQAKPYILKQSIFITSFSRLNRHVLHGRVWPSEWKMIERP